MTSGLRGGWIGGVSLLLLVFMGVEVAVRVGQRLVYGVPITTLLPGYRDTRFGESPFLVFGPRIGWQIPDKAIPELARFDQHGFRTMEPLDAGLEGEIRILAMGGSTTEDAWNEAGIHWPLVAQCLLRREGHPVRILNGAMSAYSTAHTLVRLQFTALERARPDMVLVLHNINDLTVTYRAAVRGLEVDPAYLVKYRAKGYTGEVDASDVVLLRTARAITNRFASPSPPLLPPQAWEYDLQPGLRYFQRNLGLISDLVRGQGGEVVFLTMPRSSDPEYHRASVAGALPGRAGVGVLPALPVFLSDFDRFNEGIRDVAAREGVTVLDLARGVPDRRELFVDPVHYTTEGSLRVGEVVARDLAPLLPPPAPAPVPPGPECTLLEGWLAADPPVSVSARTPGSAPARPPG